MNKEKLLYENSKHALQSDNIIAITNRHLCSRPFMEQLERVCKLHPHAIVLREKDMPEAEYLSLARDVIALCKKYDVQCMLHSFINVAMEYAQAIPSLSQAQRIRQMSKEKQLSLEKMEEIMCEVKKGEITRVAFTNEQLHKYFPNSYTPAMMKREILALLKLWKKESWES